MGYINHLPARIGFIFGPRKSPPDGGDDSKESSRPDCNKLHKKPDGKLDQRQQCYSTATISSSNATVSSSSLSSSSSSSLSSSSPSYSPAFTPSFSRSSSSSIFSRSFSLFSRSSYSLSRSSSSSSSSSFQAKEEIQGHHGHGCIERWKEELRPLLNSIRSVVSSADSHSGIVDSNGSDYNAIGPLCISRKYHHDAWHDAICPSFAASATSWSLCRYLCHAEDTIIVYWLKYCPEAVERRDFEILARVHNGGPLAIHERKESTESYWRQVNKHLEMEMGKFQKENFPFDATQIVKTHSKKDGSATCKACEVLFSPPLSVNAHIVSIHKTRTHGCKFFKIKPKLFRCNRSAVNVKVKENNTVGGDVWWKGNNQKVCIADRKLKQNVSSDVQLNNANVRECSLFGTGESCHTAHGNFVHSKDAFKRENASHGLASDYWELSENYVKGKAAVKIQAFWRMQHARGQYKRVQNAVLLIQKTWKWHLKVRLLSPDRFTQGHSRTAGMVTPSPRRKHFPGYADLLSPCKLLYRGDISPWQEDALLTELAGLLKCDTAENSPEVPCHSFEFALYSGEDNDDEICTPRLMKPEISWPSAIVLSDNSEDMGESFDSSCIEETPLAVKEALLSPFTEKEIISELAKIFPRQLDLTSHDDGITRKVSDCFQDAATEMTDGEYFGNDGNTRELTGCFARDESSDDVISLSGWHHLEMDCLNSSNEEEEDGEEDVIHPSASFISSSVTCCEIENVHQEVEKALVSSLSEWKSSLLFAEEKQGQNFDMDIKKAAFQNYQELKVVNELCRCSMKTSSCKFESAITCSCFQKVTVTDKDNKLHRDSTVRPHSPA